MLLAQCAQGLGGKAGTWLAECCLVSATPSSWDQPFDHHWDLTTLCNLRPLPCQVGGSSAAVSQPASHAQVACRVRTPAVQLVGLQYCQEIERPIPRGQAEEVLARVQATLGDLLPRLGCRDAAEADVLLAGSYRRGKPRTGEPTLPRGVWSCSRHHHGVHHHSLSPRPHSLAGLAGCPVSCSACRPLRRRLCDAYRLCCQLRVLLRGGLHISGLMAQLQCCVVFEQADTSCPLMPAGDIDVLVIMPPSAQPDPEGVADVSCGELLEALLGSLLAQGLLCDELSPNKAQPRHQDSVTWLGLCRPQGSDCRRRIDVKVYPRR